MTQPASPSKTPPQLPNFKQRERRSFSPLIWAQVSGLVILFLAGACYYYFIVGTVASAEVAKVHRGTALAGVYGTVYVSPVNQVVVRTRNYGQVTKLNVRQGDSVKKDSVIAEVSDESFQRQLESAQSSLADAQTRQEMGPPSANDLRNQQIQVDKLKILLAANNIAKIEYDKAFNELNRLKEQVAREISSQKLEVENLKRSCESIKSQMGQLSILSPLDGVVLNLYCNIGEFVSPQEQICLLGSTDNEIIAQVNEEDVGSLRPGLKAKIRLYAYQDRDLTGTLKEILPQAENQLYKVIFTVEDPPPTFLPGMTGEMNIIISEHPNVLIVPTRAIANGNQVIVVRDGLCQQLQVKTGYRTLEKTEIIEGLNEGEIVVLSNLDQYKEGTRVRHLLFNNGP